MDDRVPRDRYPRWVKLARFGAQSRRAQWFWVWASLLIGIALLALAPMWSGEPVVQAIARGTFIVAGSWGIISAGIYYLTIRWIDSHGDWS